MTCYMAAHNWNIDFLFKIMITSRVDLYEGLFVMSVTYEGQDCRCGGDEGLD